VLCCLKFNEKLAQKCVIFGGVQSSLTLFIADWTSLRALGFVFPGDDLLFRLLLVLLFLLPFLGFVTVALFTNDLDLWVVVIVYMQCTTMKKKRWRRMTCVEWGEEGWLGVLSYFVLKKIRCDIHYYTIYCCQVLFKQWMWTRLVMCKYTSWMFNIRFAWFKYPCALFKYTI